jgi:soluble lytic murein transglycosylase-like protein
MEAKTVERLHFGLRAQRRARRQKLKRRVAFLSLAATVLGLPGATLGVNLVERALGTDLAVPARGAETTESAASMLRFRSKLFERRPEETPTPTPVETAEAEAVAAEPVTATTPIYDLIAAAAAEFGLDPNYLYSVAECESGLNPGAYNAAGYHGLFQFDQTTWASYGYGDIYDPVAQARTAARLIAAGQSSRWPNCA